MRVKQVNIRGIKPYHQNPRSNESAVDIVAKSITQYGFNVPITVDSNNVIITGHTRYRAAVRLELEKVPVVVLDLDAKKVREYRIADNKTHEFSSWDKDILVSELRMIEDLDEFQDFFRSVSLEELIGGKQDFNGGGDANADDIDERAGEMGHQWDDQEKTSDQATIEIPCPNCGESCFISKSDVESRFKYEEYIRD